MKRKIDFEHDDFINTPWYYKLFSFFLYWFVAVPVLLIIKTFFLRLKVKGKANFHRVKKQGAIIVCNHVHPLDSPIIAMAILPTRMKIVSLEDNFYTPISGTLIKGLGALPVPKDYKYLKAHLELLEKLVKEGKKVLIFPEAYLIKRCQELRDFKTGAFWVAVSADVPIIPMCYTYPDNKRLTLNILPAVYPKKGEDYKQLTKRVYNIMNEFFNNQMSNTNIQNLAEESDEPCIEPLEEEVMKKKHA
mgnify:CR=1 FL=1